MCLFLQERDPGTRVCCWLWLRLSDERRWRGWCSGWTMGVPESPDEGHPDCAPPVSQTRVASHCHFLFPVGNLECPRLFPLAPPETENVGVASSV